MAAHTFDAFAAQTENLSALGFSRYLDFSVTVECGDLDFSAQRSGGKTDWHFTVQIVVVALKHGVGQQMHDHIQISRRTAVDPGLAFTR